jgi:hypothetical protein
LHRPWFASNRGSSKKYGRIARFLVQAGTAAQSASPPFSLSGAIAHDFQLERTIVWSQARTGVAATIAVAASAAIFIFASLLPRHDSPRDIRNSCFWSCKPCRFYRIRAVDVRSLESLLTCWRAPYLRSRGVWQRPFWLHGCKSVHWARDQQHRAGWPGRGCESCTLVMPVRAAIAPKCFRQSILSCPYLRIGFHQRRIGVLASHA